MNQPIVDKQYRLKTDLDKNPIYVMNFSRHVHGVADPQTSLMAWRSAVIANDVLEKEYYVTSHSEKSFLNFL